MTLEMVVGEGFQLLMSTPPLEMSDRVLAAEWNDEPLSLSGIRISRIDQNRGKPLKPADIYLGGAAVKPILSAKAHNLLAGLMENDGEFHRIQTDEEEFFYHDTVALDCLDLQMSTVKRFSDGRPMSISHPVFLPSAIAGRNIFDIKGLTGTIFVSERFSEKVREANLLGVEFRQILPTKLAVGRAN